MDRLSKLLSLTCIVLLAISGVQAQVVWQKSSANPVLPEWDGLVDNPNDYKYAFEPSVMFDSASQVYRMWFTSLAQGFGTSFVISSGISLDGQEWYSGMRNPVYRVATNGFDNSVRSPKVIRDAAGYKMYYTGQNQNSYAIGLATSADGKTWQRFSNSPILKPDTVSRWDSLAQAFCDVYFDGSTYFMWFAGGDGLHGGIGLAQSNDGIHWIDVPGNPVFTASGSGWDAGSVTAPAVVRVGRLFYMFYCGSPDPASVNFSVGLATSRDGVHWARYGTSPVLTKGSGWEGASLGSVTVLYRNGTFFMWYSALSSMTGHWQLGYATSPVFTLGLQNSQTTPGAFTLEQNYPNPFNPSTTIRYGLPKSSHVTLSVFNTLGQRVATLVNENQEAGYHSVRFNGTGVSTGAYFYRIQADNNVETKRLLLLR